MVDDIGLPLPDEDLYETEVIVEEIPDDGRRRTILVVVLIVLLLLLVGLGYYAYRATAPAPGSNGVIEGDESGLVWVRSIYGWGADPSEQLRRPVSVSVARDGTIWTVSGHSTVIGFRPDGVARHVIPLDPSHYTSIEGIEVADNGEIYLADFGANAIHVINEQGELLREWGVQLPMDMAVDGDRVAVAAAYGIGVFDTDGTLINKFGARGNQADQVDLPHGIEWTADGLIVVSDTQNHRVKTYTPDGRLVGVFPEANLVAPRVDVESTMVEAQGDQPFQLPTGLTRDSTGRMVLVDPFRFAIIALDSQGATETARWGDFGAEDGAFGYPTGIEYDPGRDYFVVADTANNRLQIVRLPGSGTNVLGAAALSVWDNGYCFLGLPLYLLLAALAYWFVRQIVRRRTAGLSEPRDEA